MRIFTKIIALLLLFGGFAPTWAQDGQKRVTLTITREADGVTVVKDTSFFVDDVEEVERILNRMGLDEPQPNQTLEKRVVIRDVETSTSEERVVARVQNKPFIGVRITETHNSWSWNSDDNRSQQSDEREAGAYVSSIIPGTGAEAAGLRAGDVIVDIDGRTIRNNDDVAAAKRGKQPGDIIRLSYLRDGQLRRTNVTLGQTQTRLSTPSPSGSLPAGLHTKNGVPGRYETETLKKAFLGVYPAMVNREIAEDAGLGEERGFYVSRTVEGKSAEIAGIEDGDIILEMDGRAINSPAQLREFLTSHEPGDRVNVAYWRDGRRRFTTVELGGKTYTKKRFIEADDLRRVTRQRAYLGVMLATNNEENGVRITDLIDGLAAEAAGLETGDRILAIDGKPTPTYAELSRVMGEIEANSRVNVRIRRDGDVRNIPVTMGSRNVTEWIVDEKKKTETIDIDVMVRRFGETELGQELQRQETEPTLDMETFTLFPNPNDGRFTLRFTPVEEGPISLRIFDLQGREIFAETLTDFSGTYEKSFDLSAEAAGIYFLQVEQNGRLMAKRIVKELR